MSPPSHPVESKPRGPWLARHSGWVAHAAISLLVAALGCFALQWREVFWARLGTEVVDWQDAGMDPWQRLSFDLPFLVRSSLPVSLHDRVVPVRRTDEVVLLYMDEDSAARLGQSVLRPWNREVHARLLERLKAEKALAVMFDIIFDSDAPEDAEFARAIAAHGNVFLGATIKTNSEVPLTPQEAQRFLEVGLATEQLLRPNRVLGRAARGWGLLTFRPLDSDYGVRRLFAGKPREGLDSWPAITWQMAKTLGANLPADPVVAFSRRWVNYLGPAGRIEGISYHRVLDADGGVPPGYFKDKIVIVGARSQIAVSARKQLDEFSTPWSRFRGHAYTTGAEIHANILLNLLHRDWLGRVPVATEMALTIFVGLGLGALRWLRPRPALVVAVAAMVVIATASWLVQWQGLLWWNWSVPVLLQIPSAFVLAVGSRYYLEERQRRKLRQAFGLYLSPELATEIADRNFTLTPGGEKVEATLLFTDLEGFTSLSEKLGDSARVGLVLQDYFTRTTDEILAEKGTVIKFIGDAVYAAWGAPLPQPDHPERAVRAAWRLAQVASLDVTVDLPGGGKETVHLRTRIGIHTGEALAGNLGSKRRFDYTLIGDAVNFASRLEGANKYTGTGILLSDDTARRLDGKFLLRRLGAFRVKGRTKATVVHELLGEDPTVRPPWLETFEAALEAWERGDLPAARDGFVATQRARGGMDGPSQFFLELIEHTVIAPGWTGEVPFSEK